MKNFILTLVLVAVFSSAGCFIGGCSIFGDMKAASVAFVESKEDFEKAGAALKLAYDEVMVIKAQYEEAVKSGDKTKVEALIVAGAEAVAKYQVAVESYDSTKIAITGAIKKIEEVEGSQKYGMGILTILGGLIGVAGGALGGRYPVVKQLADLTAGVFKTMAAADKNLPPAEYTAFAKEVGDKMTPKEFAVFNKAAGANAIDPGWKG